MSGQTPNGGAGSRTFAGPWLRFHSGTEPGNKLWTGSALCVTRPNSSGAEDGANGSVQPPTLTLTDSGGDGGGEQALTAVQLDSCEGWVFWRFDLALQLTAAQRAVQYTVTADGTTTPAYTFWLPGLGQPMHWGYYSCNGMSADIAADAPQRADPTYLWRDLMQQHAASPMHCLVGGGDQLYNDGVWKVPSLHAWGAITDHAEQVAGQWSPEMEAQATYFYLENYIDSFCLPDVLAALAQIAQVMMWDDHDIWDGYGSYDPDMQNCVVFQNLFRIARRFYLLFQQHTTDTFNAKAQEFLTNDGTEFHYVKYMGPQVVVLGMDMRSQRTKAQIMPQSSYALLKRTVAELPAGVEHLVVLSGIPLVFPKIPAAETVLGCVGGLVTCVPGLKSAAAKTGLLDRFDQPEILDDLVDGWVADVHTDERLQFIKLLQDFATTKELRVSILSGDAHVGGVGRLYSRHKIHPIKDDPLFMPQIISSAIVNAPPPHPVVKMLMRTNFASNVDGRTREKMVRAFYPHHPRTDKLLGQRNWCDVIVAPPAVAGAPPSDAHPGDLCFILRVEDAKHRKGHAEEIYTVVAPRFPGAAARVTAKAV